MVDFFMMCPNCRTFSFKPVCPQCQINIQEAWQDIEALAHARIWLAWENGDLPADWEVPKEWDPYLEAKKVNSKL